MASRAWRPGSAPMASSSWTTPTISSCVTAYATSSTTKNPTAMFGSGRPEATSSSARVKSIWPNGTASKARACGRARFGPTAAKRPCGTKAATAARHARRKRGRGSIVTAVLR
eukprot:CAMPEP_0184123614 /NCGR_PEP_ID=MMETSP0974-20121125/24092_1 /TAXON_ID=483370 /ORGANISM="non described non described, Strain CCMP2097" /LENGTH=112 /DNA_ID=CAMNT_0026426885 /DNA_START=142 /DNA_END=476 /DNA_ORIENTATION=+